MPGGIFSTGMGVGGEVAGGKRSAIGGKRGFRSFTSQKMSTKRLFTGSSRGKAPRRISGVRRGSR
jgi:hypothetical protein